MKYYNLLILFMIDLKCGAVFAVENVTNSEVVNASTAEGKLTNISSFSEPNGSENTLINATDDNAVEVKKKEFDLPIPGTLAQQGTRMVKNIIGTLMKGVTQLNEPVSKEGAGDSEEPTTEIFSTVEYVTNSKVPNASTTEAPENLFEKWTQLPNIIKSTLTNVTFAYAINPFKNKEFGKLPLPRKLPGHRTRLVTNIIGSLMKGLAQLKEPDSEEDVEDDDEEPTTVNYSSVENVTNSEVSNASTTEAPENLFDKWTQLPNIIKCTLINATAINPFNNKEFGKLPLPKKLPGQRTRLVTNIIGSLMKGLAQLKEPDSEEDYDDLTSTTVNYSTVENVTNSEVFNASTTEAPDKRESEPPGAVNTLINATNVKAVSPFRKTEFGKLPLPRKLPGQRTRLVTNIIGSLMEGLAQLKEPDSEEDYDELTSTTVNYSTVENITKSEVFNASTTEAPDNSESEPPGAVNTLLNATNVKAVSPFRKTEFGKLPLPRKLPGQRTRLVTNIVGSLMKGLAQLKEPDSEEDDEESTTVNYSTVENVTNCEVSNANTTEAPDNHVDKWTALPNINISSSSGSPATENTLIKATDGNAVGPSKKKEFGKLSIPGTLPQQGTRVVTNIIGSLLKGLL